ncbi:MAG: penicillin-binding protein activator [Chromatiaceae bacterium]|nr:MAG: penicillin-binding protein activator [Chromatiaceae bacterium]
MAAAVFAPRPNQKCQRRTSSLTPLVALLAVLLAASGCAIDPTRDADRVLAAVPGEPLARAAELARRGEPAAAAELYLELAEAAVPPARQQLELDAARALLQAGQTDEANRVLIAIDKTALTSVQRELVLLLEADVALQRGRAEDAIARLGRVNQRTLPADLRAQYFSTLAAAQRLNKDPLAAAQALDQRDRLLRDDPAARLDNQVSLLFTLSTLGPSGLDGAARETSGRMRGWVELARLVGGFGAASPELDSRYAQWRGRNRMHPAEGSLVSAYFRTLAGGYPANTEVLVLLPRGGRFGTAGNAVRDGIQAAREADRSGNRPNLDFRDASGRVTGPFDRGVDGGAQLVIGPLDREGVDSLAGRPALRVPTLALNRSGGGTASNLYQFSLAPEDEAINAANLAWAAGLRSAALLYPSDPWGERMATAYRGQWRTLGGRMLAEQSYSPTAGNHARAVDALLAGGTPDLVFLVATTAEVRPLWSALQLGLPRIPAIATSHVYDGDIDPSRDEALAGLYFVEIPWLLDQARSDSLSRRALTDRLPNVRGPLARLYAMGIDAYRLAPRISEMGRSPGTFFPGETGGLNIDSLGQVRRQLVLARFTPGGPRVQQRIEVRPAPAAADAGDSDD